MGRGISVSAGSRVNFVPHVNVTLEMSPQLNDALDNMAEELGVPKGEAVLKAFSLLKIALEARQEGKRLTIVDDRDDSEQDITL